VVHSKSLIQKIFQTKENKLKKSYESYRSYNLLTNELNRDKLVKIYSFFNVCKIYEIEEELFIYGFDEIR